MDGNDCATRNSLLNTPKRHKEGFLAFKIFDEKWFYIIALAHMSFLTTLATLMNVMEDFGRDKKLEPVTARNLVAIFAATDIIGRLGSPWITDGGYIAREHLFILDLFLKAVCHSLLGLANNPIVIICLVAWSGWLFGSISILFANILTQKLGARYLPIATGWYLFFAGLLGLTRPRAIGYFREQLGTYSPIIFFLAGFSALAGTVYLVAHLLERKRKISGVEMTLADRDHRPDSGRSRTNSQTANL